MSTPNDFDFFIGSWSTKHRRLKERLVGCRDWEEFGGTTQTWLTLGGAGNCDDNYLEFPGGHYRAMTLRTFDLTKLQWSIWWLDARHPGQLDTPVVGTFANGLGTFYAEDRLNGVPITVRFLWRRQPDDTPIWEQAFSADAGISWETNWTMEFTRAD